MDGTSEQEPPERDRAPRHLHAVPPPAEDSGSGAPAEGGADGGTHGEQGATPGPQAPPGGPSAASNGSAPQASPPASGTYGAADGTSGTAAGSPGTPNPLLSAPAGHILARAGLYVVLLVFGLLLGLTGAFQFSRSLGPVPVSAVLFVLAIGATCWLCGRATRSVAGALVPAMGWIVASFAMAMPNTSGSVVITNSIAGEIYLYGGALCAAIGVGAAFGGWTRAQQAASPARSAGTRRPRP